MNSEYKITDKETGKEITPEEFLTEYFLDRAPDKKGFEITYPHQLRKFFNVAGTPRTSVLLFLLEKKSIQNTISETNKSISESLNISKTTVSFVMKKLQDEGLLKKIRQGTYLLNPDISTYGGPNSWRARDTWNTEGNTNV